MLQPALTEALYALSKVRVRILGAPLSASLVGKCRWHEDNGAVAEHYYFFFAVLPAADIEWAICHKFSTRMVSLSIKS